MSKKVEIEQKYYCSDFKKLIEVINKKGFSKINEKREIDEYFTDINSEFIRNRTCLRIRITNDERMELTFKGKSKELTNNYAKIENNIDIEISNYDSIVGLLYSLGYFSYSIVDKKRITYTKKEEDLEYNIMVDELEKIGSFIEFELLYYKDEKDIGYLQNKLNQFVKEFECLNFKSANLPYRDFVAHQTYISILPTNKLTTLLFDLDGTLINSEKKFFESFRSVIYSKYNYNISHMEYENNELKQNANLINYLKEKNIIAKEENESIIMQQVYTEYEKKFMELLDENEVLLNFELLKKIKNKGLRLGLVSTSKIKFINILLQKLNIENLFEIIVSREDVENLKPAPDAYLLALKKMNILSDSCIAFEDSERGINAALSTNIKTIQVDDYKENKSNEKISRILLAIINHIGG